MALTLSGCNDNSGYLQAEAVQTPARSGLSPAGASVAFVTVEGAPAEITTRFSQISAAEANRRDVTLAAPASAHYLVRGYLSASTTEGGTALTCVWDVFDTSRRRVQRTEDSILVKSAVSDPWSVADERALTNLAARSADALANVLSSMPEALASRGAPAAIAASATPAVAATLPASLPASLRAYR